MKNVMTRAWEIAKQGQKKFGGNVKEFFAAALKMAWKEVKNVVDIGLEMMGGKNGVMFFVTNDIEGLEVSFLSTKKNVYNGKMITKRNAITEYQLGTNNKTNKTARMYNVAVHCGDIEIKLNDKIETIKNSYDKAKWGL